MTEADLMSIKDDLSQLHDRPVAPTDCRIVRDQRDVTRIADLERALGEMVLALEYERSRIRQPSVSGKTAIADAKRVLDQEE